MNDTSFFFKTEQQIIDDKKQNTDNISAAKKELKNIARNEQARVHFNKWRAVESYRAEVKALQEKLNLTSLNLTRYDSLYLYRLGKQRTSDKNTAWVKKFIKEGGSYQTLEANANEWLINECLKLVAGKKRKKSKSDMTVIERTMVDGAKDLDRGTERTDGRVKAKDIISSVEV
jgi:hypothetical protein